MKKFLALGVLCAALVALVGCNDSKTTGGPVTKVNTNTAAPTNTTPGAK